MSSAISLAAPRFIPQLSRAIRPTLTESTSTPRVEIPRSQSITPNLIPSGHREAVMSGALGAQTMFIRGFGGPNRSLSTFEDAPSESTPCSKV